MNLMRREKIKKFIIVASILLIIVLATFFHFEIHFENALTNLPDANFGVRISIWRYIFEPVLGILLFFNRSIYPLKELPLALIWITILYLLFGVIQAYKKRDGSKNVLIKKLSNIPLLLGICFSIFALIM